MHQNLSLSAQNASQNNLTLVEIKKEAPDTVSFLMSAFFELEATNSPLSRQAQKRDFELFLNFMFDETGNDERTGWSPRLSGDFKKHLQRIKVESPTGGQKRRWSDRTINRVLTHLKKLSKWIHTHRPFPLGDPMKRVKAIPLTNTMEIERAITNDERRRILDAADLLPVIGGRSKDRHRYKSTADMNGQSRPNRKGYRPWRNRAIIYTLIETGMRRAGVTHIELQDLNFQKHLVPTLEKGGIKHPYPISREGLDAIQTYLDRERNTDNTRWHSPTLFLPALTVAQGKDQLSVKAINRIWQNVCTLANVTGKTPHSARHGMGKYLAKARGIEVVKRQLGHQNIGSSVAYARPSNREMQEVLDERN
jgi:integrase